MSQPEKENKPQSDPKNAPPIKDIPAENVSEDSDDVKGGRMPLKPKL